MINREQLHEILEQLQPNNVKLIAVSKTKPIEAIQAMYDEGQKVFGENRIQELVAKYEELPKDIEWHMIGHLQTNKVKYIAPFVQCIHAIDSERLLKVVDKQAAKHNRIIDCLLQIHIAEEATKFGFLASEIKKFLHKDLLSSYKNVRICGLMGMATYTNNQEQIAQEFEKLHSLFYELKQTVFSNVAYFKELSMGMSGDYQIAVEKGSTMVRIGSLLFGYR